MKNSEIYHAKGPVSRLYEIVILGVLLRKYNGRTKHLRVGCYSDRPMVEFEIREWDGI